MRKRLPPGEILSTHLVGFKWFVGTGGRTLTLTHQYQYGVGVVTATTTMASSGHHWIIRGLHLGFWDPPAPPIDGMVSKT
jgi:hypothetical protein